MTIAIDNNRKQSTYAAHGLRMVAIVYLMLTACGTRAQSVPANLLDLSIEELFAANIIDSEQPSSDSIKQQPARWRVQYQYQRSDFEGYTDGSNKLSNSGVMFSPGFEARTDDNFPIIPTTIVQQAHAFVVGYELQAEMTLSVAVPYIKQSTDHVSVVAGYDMFTIHSEGMGDISVMGSYTFNRTLSSSWQFSIGASFPTGSIDEEGDTPRAPGNQQLPYTMQLGSGTYDIPLSITHLRMESSYSWGAELAAKLRTGENDRDYRLGNRLLLSSWLRLNKSKWAKPSITLTYEYTDRIHGMDVELLAGGAFPYPAPVTNPDLFGGEKVTVVLGLRIPVTGAGKYIDLELGKPVYQNLNGPQTREDIHFGFKIQY